MSCGFQPENVQLRRVSADRLTCIVGSRHSQAELLEGNPGLRSQLSMLSGMKLDNMGLEMTLMQVLHPPAATPVCVHRLVRGSQSPRWIDVG